MKKIIKLDKMKNINAIVIDFEIKVIEFFLNSETVVFTEKGLVFNKTTFDLS